MRDLMPLQTLYEAENGTAIPLPEELESLYGRLAFPFKQGKPYLISDFVETLDGVVTLGLPGHESGGEISGNSRQDLMVMGLLRAVADAVIITSVSLKVGGDRPHTPAESLPELAQAFASLRSRLDKSGLPLQVVVTSRGKIDVKHPILQSGQAPALVVTTEEGKRELERRELSSSIPVMAMKQSGTIDGCAIVEAVSRHCKPGPQLLVSEGGPHLLGCFVDANCLDELFLTVAPQLAGRDHQGKRLGLVEGHVFAPDKPRWEELVSVKRGGGHLFLRYRFGRT